METSKATGRIDAHSHYAPEVLIDCLRSRRSYPYLEGDVLYLSQQISWGQEYVRRLAESLKERLRFMDANGIESALICPEQGLQLFPPEESAEAVRLMKAVNDAVYHAATRYPGRFYGVATLVFTDVKAAVAEMERCVKELGFVGCQVYTNFGKKNLDDPEFAPLLEKAQELNTVLFLHHATLPDRGKVASIGTQLHPLGYAADCSITFMRMIFQGLFDRYPGLRIVVHHLGEALPYVAEKIDTQALMGDEIAPACNQHPVSYYLKKHVYVTADGCPNPENLRFAAACFSPEHILFGTDYPFDAAKTAEMVWEEAGLSGSGAYYRGNALRLLFSERMESEVEL